MAIIDAAGLFYGERLRKCSNSARLHWPYFFLASNGFGRLEIDYHRIVATAFASFRPVPTEKELMGYVREYSDAHLVFLFRSADGAVWGQWDCKPQRLNKYKTAADRRSPDPPEPAFTDWQNSYANGLTKTIPVSLADISENLPQSFREIPETLRQDLPFGDGIGDGERQYPATTAKNVTNRNKNKGKECSTVALELAQLLQDQILRNNPKAKITPKQVENWAVVADRMMRCDSRSQKEIEQTISFSQKHPFWSLNILSMEKLREKFDQLTLQRRRERGQEDGDGQDDHSEYKLSRPQWIGLDKKNSKKEPRQ